MRYYVDTRKELIKDRSNGSAPAEKCSGVHCLAEIHDCPFDFNDNVCLKESVKRLRLSKLGLLFFLFTSQYCSFLWTKRFKLLFGENKSCFYIMY